MLETKNYYSRRNHDNGSMYPELVVRNLLKNPWWTSGTSGWVINSGNVLFEEDEAGFMNLAVDSISSSQIKQIVNLKPRHRYFVMFEIEVSRYAKGLFGVHISGRNRSETTNIGLRRLSKDKKYETVIGIFKVEGDQPNRHSVFVGSIGGANGAGKIRKLSFYDLTDLYGEDSEPTAQEFYSSMLSMLENQNEFGMHATLSRVYHSLDGKINQIKRNSFGISNEEAHGKFIQEMNKKISSLNMTNTVLKERPEMDKVELQSTTRDFLKLGLHILGHNELLKIWGIKKFLLDIQGPNARKTVVATNSKKSYLEKKYDFLEGKIVSDGPNEFNILTLVSDKKENLYLVVVIEAINEDDCFEAVDQLILNSQSKIDGFEALFSQPFKAGAGSVLKVPSGNPLYFINAVPPSISSVNEEKLVMAGSLLRFMTALLAIENISNLNELVTVDSTDILEGRGPVMYEGDQISIKEALQLLLLSDSDTAEKLISRVIGHKIVQARDSIK
ncbi:hypothetical protein [Enterococcus sp. AZ007]|uniref:hypothetical protein n=1 Tax=Enterococcus sp. AZ007 TaxID=2774839 RepID=UPI003F21D81C